MNFFLAFLQSKTKHEIPAYDFWEYYIKNGLTDAGLRWSEVSDVDWAEGLTYQDGSVELDAWKAKSWEKTLAFVTKNRPNVFLSYLYPKQIDVQAVKQIQRLGIPCVNFFCDNVREFRKLPSEFKIFDLNWVPEVEAIQLYKSASLNYLHLPMPMWVSPGLRQINRKFNNDITFIGSRDIQRTLLFNKLIQDFDDENLKIYGKGWLKEDVYNSHFIRKSNMSTRIKTTLTNGLVPALRQFYQNRFLNIYPSSKTQNHISGTVTFNKYIEITKASCVTLGVNRYPNVSYPLNKPHTYSRLRDIEAPMLGACYVTERAADLALFYSDNELLTYRDTDGLIEIIKLLKSYSTDQRHNYITKIQSTALNELSVAKSINKLITKLN